MSFCGGVFLNLIIPQCRGIFLTLTGSWSQAFSSDVPF